VYSRRASHPELIHSCKHDFCSDFDVSNSIKFHSSSISTIYTMTKVAQTCQFSFPCTPRSPKLAGCYNLGEGVCVVNHWSYLVTLSLSVYTCARVVLLCHGLISCRVTAQSFVVGGLALLCAHSVALIVALSSRSCSCLLTSNISCSRMSTCPRYR
jgi:hypothetical protein